MAWREQYALGVPEMDHTHREFIELTEALLGASDEEFAGVFARLHDHTRQHFEAEGKLMKACRFPATGEHLAEHLRVLGELAFFSRSVANGRLASAKAYAQSLPGWFATHLATMDAALGACLKQRAAA